MSKHERELIGAGQYWLYEQPNGSALLQWNDAGGGEDSEQEIPAEVWKLLRAVVAGKKIGPQAALRMLTGGRTARRRALE